MPPKRSTKPKDDPDSDEERLDDLESDEDVWDPDYQEEHLENKSKEDEDDDEPKQKADDDDIEKIDDSEDEKDVDADIDFDVMDYPDEEAGGDEIDPPRPELVKNRYVIPPDERTTSERMSLFECGRVLGDRARHIDNKARPNVDTKNATSSLEIAYIELKQKRIPMAVIRKVGLGAVEIWRVKEMTLPKLPPIDYFRMTIH